VQEVIILAGGKGERLRPLTHDRPKAMVEIMGSPILGYQLRWLKSAGIKRVLISCGYLHEVIADYFGDGSKWGVQIEYLVESEPLGRGGGMKRALRQVENKTEPVLALNGDLITNLDLQATLVVVPLKSPFGIVDIDGDTVTGFREKPILPFFINAGIYVLAPSIMDLLPDKGDHEELTFPQLAKNHELKAYKSEAFWRTVDTVKDVSELRNELESMLYGAFFHKTT
jgi:NDP-sugar pyrophosphorylase family protein